MLRGGLTGKGDLELLQLLVCGVILWFGFDSGTEVQRLPCPRNHIKTVVENEAVVHVLEREQEPLVEARNDSLVCLGSKSLVNVLRSTTSIASKRAAER